MTDAILLLLTHLCKGTIKALGTKDRVVAKSTLPLRRFRNHTAYLALKAVLLIIQDQSDDSPEDCAPVLCTIQLVEELPDVICWTALRSRIASCIDTGATIKSRHLKTGVISEAIYVVTLMTGLSLDHRVLTDRRPRLLYLLIVTHLVEGHQVIRQSLEEYEISYLLSLVLIVSRQEQPMPLAHITLVSPHPGSS